MKKQTTYVALVLDDSGSMGHLRRKMVQMVNDQIASLKADAKRTGQETRLSIYTFGEKVKRICFKRDLDDLPEVESYYTATQGCTAMIDGTTLAINDHKEIALGRDDAVLIYVFTDGLENVNAGGGPALKKLVSKLSDDFTVSASVPNLQARDLAIGYGIPDDNVQVWDTTEKGMDTVSMSTQSALTSYMTCRATGMKSTKTLFKFEPITKKEVVKKLDVVDPADYETHIVRPYYDGYAIKDFVEAVTSKPYRVGSAYYQVSKPEKIQAGKVVAVVEKATGKMFSGHEARKLIGLPAHEVKASPADFRDFDLFVQSTSTNRKLVKDTHLVVFK